jgi:hypothetical protein
MDAFPPMSLPADGIQVTYQRVERRGKNNFLIRHLVYPTHPDAIWITVYLGQNKQIIDQATDSVSPTALSNDIDVVEQSLISSLMLAHTYP